MYVDLMVPLLAGVPSTNVLYDKITVEQATEPWETYYDRQSEEVRGRSEERIQPTSERVPTIVEARNPIEGRERTTETLPF